ncbi:MAG TPA: hypothetical protein VL201_00545, partial [Patescibacteria group bacterium]|nr:hypothetical protein [Patescibacteria group bacterium]
KNDQYDHSTIILRHLDHELKEKDISMPYGFLVNSFFVASQYLVIGSHVLESQQSTKKINNKYRIDIFDVAAFIKNESVTSDNLNGDLEYYLGIDIEDTNTNTNPEDSDSLFTLESVHDNILFLCNEITKQFINLDFLNHAENTKQPENILIHYAFQKPKYLEIFSIFDENIISPFTKIYNLTIDKKIPVIRYENKHAQFVEVQQTCPIILTTNFFIKVEQKSAQDIYNYTEDQRLEEIDFCFDPDRFITVVDEDALRLFMNTFLGNIETNQSDLRVYYRVQENIDPQVDTVIKCCQYAKEAFGVPSSKTYRCFSLESRLLATYSSAFSPSCPEPYDERYQILLQHLDNKEKKYTIKTNEDLTIKSIFLKESYLIVGSSSHRYSDKKSQYHIDIYDATKFSKNSEMLTSSDTHNSVDYFLGIDVEIDAQYTAETQENIKFKHVPCKLLTIKDGCCVLLLKEKEETEHYLYIPFLDEKEEKRNIHGYSITYRKNPIPESIPQSISKSIPESKSLTQNNKPHWFKKHCIPIGTVGTIVFALLLYGYHNKKCASLFN